MTVSRLMEILAKCSAEREVWLLDDCVELPLAVVMPDFPMGQEPEVVMLAAGAGWAGLEVLS